MCYKRSTMSGTKHLSLMSELLIGTPGTMFIVTVFLFTTMTFLTQHIIKGAMDGAFKCLTSKLVENFAKGKILKMKKLQEQFFHPYSALAMASSKSFVPFQISFL